MNIRLIFVLSILAVAACENSARSGKPITVILSEPHSICLTASDIALESSEKAVDYDYGIIESKNGVKVSYYVSSEPGRAGYGHMVSTRSLGHATKRGKPIVEELFSDGNRSLRIDGFRSGVDGNPKIHVKFDFSSNSDSEFMLASRLIDAVEHCGTQSAN